MGFTGFGFQVAHTADDAADATRERYHDVTNAAGEKIGQARDSVSNTMRDGANAIDNGVQGTLASIAFCMLPLFVVHYLTC
ncbi:unnamed protein product [Strongylus vulgaris]|uniref:Uncharacterized protein n=1 Tax=Strongylus vulgaris TaxID=40348 RepID=A0A3P7KWS5_STRVU|nr:unnamed protein product [Strongylus vulgaris]